jgi:MFS family permease
MNNSNIIVNAAVSSRAYRYYVLIVMLLTYMVSTMDRQIMTLLAPYIKVDFNLSDAQIGMLYGTAFSLFYGVFGMPLSKLADCWSRVKTIWMGLLFWSMMTGLSGGAGNFGHLGVARAGVGLGEASSSPAAISLLGDYFGPRRRSTVIALYGFGGFVGAGLAIAVGGAIIAFWATHFPTPLAAPFGLHAWQVTFIALMLPGVALALIVALTLREPLRGILDGDVRPDSPTPLRLVAGEIGAMLPPWSFIEMKRRGGSRNLRVNLLAAVVIAFAAAGITHFTDGLLPVAKRVPLARIGGLLITTNLVQWAALALAIYACFSWAQNLRVTAPDTFKRTVGSKPFVALVLACGLNGFGYHAMNSFIFLYATKYLGFGPGDASSIGAITAICGGTGIVAGGVVGDLAREHYRAGRIYVACLSFAMLTIGGFVAYTSESRSFFLAALGLATAGGTVWISCVAATAQDLVLPNMRGVAFALPVLGGAIMGFGLGPYTIGLLSDVLGDLRTALLLSTIAGIPGMICLFYTAYCLRSPSNY